VGSVCEEVEERDVELGEELCEDFDERFDV
jgi:hypothetical protein